MPSRLGLQLRAPLVEVKPRRRARVSKTAPAARYAFGQTRSLKVSLIALWLCGAGVTFYLLQTRPVHDLYPWLAGSSLLIGAAAAYRGWAQSKTGTLRWDGNDWWTELQIGAAVSPPGLVTDLRVQFDFQFFLLIRMSSAGGDSQWLWLDSWTQRSHWGALRRAVFSPKPAADMPVSAIAPGQPPPIAAG